MASFIFVPLKFIQPQKWHFMQNSCIKKFIRNYEQFSLRLISRNNRHLMFFLEVLNASSFIEIFQATMTLIKWQYTYDGLASCLSIDCQKSKRFSHSVHSSVPHVDVFASLSTFCWCFLMKLDTGGCKYEEEDRICRTNCQTTHLPITENWKSTKGLVGIKISHFCY